MNEDRNIAFSRPQEVRIPLVRNIQQEIASPLTAVCGALFILSAVSIALLFAPGAKTAAVCAAALSAGILLEVMCRRAKNGGVTRMVPALVTALLFYAAALAIPAIAAAGYLTDSKMPGAYPPIGLFGRLNIPAGAIIWIRLSFLSLCAAVLIGAGTVFLTIFRTFGDGVPRRGGIILLVCAAVAVSLCACAVGTADPAMFAPPSGLRNLSAAGYSAATIISSALAEASVITLCVLFVKINSAVKRSVNV